MSIIDVGSPEDAWVGDMYGTGTVQMVVGSMMDINMDPGGAALPRSPRDG